MQLPEGIDSKFRYVLLVAKRAEQLIQGAAPKSKSRFTKPTRQAMEEIRKDQVRWQLTEPEEGDFDTLLANAAEE
ncbi:MAG TPA: DNA-directed RNA polymerase subunit omega [Thermoanaerobaculia bacterium]|nr:DNA-directed RNA polymerase subunit omega [Thermoanaerobaculia bacterium]